MGRTPTDAHARGAPTPPSSGRTGPALRLAAEGPGERAGGRAGGAAEAEAEGAGGQRAAAPRADPAAGRPAGRRAEPGPARGGRECVSGAGPGRGAAGGRAGRRLGTTASPAPCREGQRHRGALPEAQGEAQRAHQHTRRAAQEGRWRHGRAGRTLSGAPWRWRGVSRCLTCAERGHGQAADGDAAEPGGGGAGEGAAGLPDGARETGVRAEGASRARVGPRGPDSGVTSPAPTLPAVTRCPVPAGGAD